MNRHQPLVFAKYITQFTPALITPFIIGLWGGIALAVSAAQLHGNKGTVQKFPKEPSTNYKVEVLLPPNVVSENSARGKSSSFTPREVDFRIQPTQQVPTTADPPSSKAESYLVYVNEANLQRLQQVQRLEPTAFVRLYQKQSVIQAGVFSQNANAQNLAIKLEYQGIDARIVSLATGEDKDFVSKFYFVVIPAKREKLADIQAKVQQLKMGMQVNISQKAEPKTHIRVGPFLEKKQAENWKRYLKASGLRKARVYYGQ